MIQAERGARDQAAARDGISLVDRRVLHLGCGRKHMPDAVNVDLVADVSPDVVHNLEKKPWPFPDNRFDKVVMTDVLEHLDDTIGAMEEIHRVCRNGAKVHIVVPHFSSANAYTDITHRRFFAHASFDYFTDDHAYSFYTRSRFRRMRVDIQFHPTLVNKAVWRLANRFTVAYEQRWCWLFPAWFLAVELEVVKG
jgi:SAM-dependent methyltransferase